MNPILPLTTIGDLPSETVEHILKYVADTPRNFAIAALVCRLWSSITEGMRFKHVSLKGRVNYENYPSHWKIGKTISQSYHSETISITKKREEFNLQSFLKGIFGKDFVFKREPKTHSERPLLCGKTYIFDDFVVLDPNDERFPAPLVIPCSEKIRNTLRSDNRDEFYIYSESHCLKKIKLDPNSEEKFSAVWELDLRQLKKKDEPVLHLDKKREISESDLINREDDCKDFRIEVMESGGFLALECWEVFCDKIKIIDLETQSLIQKIDTPSLNSASSFIFPKLILEDCGGGFTIYEYSPYTQKFERIVSDFFGEREFLEDDDERFKPYFGLDFEGNDRWDATSRFFWVEAYHHFKRLGRKKEITLKKLYVIDLDTGKTHFEDLFKEYDDKREFHLLWDHRLVYIEEKELLIVDPVTKKTKSLSFHSLVSEALGPISCVNMKIVPGALLDTLELVFKYKIQNEESGSQTMIKRLRLIPDVL